MGEKTYKLLLKIADLDRESANLAQIRMLDILVKNGFDQIVIEIRKQKIKKGDKKNA